MRFSVVVNCPGYLPDGQPIEFDEAADAADCMADELARTASAGTWNEQVPEVPKEAWVQLLRFLDNPNEGFAFSFKGYEHDIAVNV